MKKSYIYAHLDENNICFAVTVHPSPMKGTQLVELTEKDDSLLRKKYVDGEWVEIPSQPQPELPTELEEIKAELAYLRMTKK